MEYVILDLEWNQNPFPQHPFIQGQLRFEIIEIGAVKVNAQGINDGAFHAIIKPQVYKELFPIMKNITHLTIGELEQGIPFQEAMKQFFSWSGDNCVYCTWGNMDLEELQNNLDYFEIENPLPFPLLYYDLQKLFSIQFEDGKLRRSLEHAVEMLQIEKSRPFHRAMEDVWYTEKIMARMDMPVLEIYKSVDYHRIPLEKKQEIFLDFRKYTKYVSRGFSTREEALSDKQVYGLQCCICKKLLRKKIRWFTPNYKQYYCAGFCEQHGWMKGKIRLKKHEEMPYVVKTCRSISGEDVLRLGERQKRIREKRKKHMQDREE